MTNLEIVSAEYTFTVGLGQIWPKGTEPFSRPHYSKDFLSITAPETAAIEESIIGSSDRHDELQEGLLQAYKERLVSAYFMMNAVIKIRHPEDERIKFPPDYNYPNEMVQGQNLGIGEDYIVTDRSGSELKWETVSSVIESGKLPEYTARWFGMIVDGSYRDTWHGKLESLYRSRKK
jgi:hypothetical protein